MKSSQELGIISKTGPIRKKEKPKPKLIKKRIRAKWKRPQGTVYKINVDGSVRPTGECRVGGIVRDSEGRVVDIFYHEIDICLVVQTEARAVVIGLQLAKRRCFRRVIVEGDNLEVIKAINQKDHTRWEILREIEGINKVRPEFDSTNFQHYFREANRAAYYIAKKGAINDRAVIPYNRDLCTILFLDDHGATFSL